MVGSWYDRPRWCNGRTSVGYKPSQGKEGSTSVVKPRARDPRRELSAATTNTRTARYGRGGNTPEYGTLSTNLIVNFIGRK